MRSVFSTDTLCGLVGHHMTGNESRKKDCGERWMLTDMTLTGGTRVLYQVQQMMEQTHHLGNFKSDVVIH